jgi:hypothetical protein
MEYKNLEKLSIVIQKEIDAVEIAGAEIIVIHNNEVFYQDELGFADIEQRTAI